MKIPGSPADGGKQIFVAVAYWEGPHYVHHDVGKPLVWDLKRPRVCQLLPRLRFHAGITNFNEVLDIMFK